MKILVTGAGGMIGRKLVERLVAEGSLRGQRIAAIHAVDIGAPAFDGGDIEIVSQAVDFRDNASVPPLIDMRPDVVFHLAAIVSGEAEADFDKGYEINLGGTQALFDAIAKAETYVPRVVFASSIAVFGAPFPDKIGDTFATLPLTSYGTQKAIGELLLADYTRKGLMDGIGLRLPTIVVRPGKPNLAASGFFSNILREPMAGHEAVLPVDEDVRHWMASPRSAVGFFMHAAQIDGARVGPRRNLTMPGLSMTVGEMIEGLRAFAGDEAADRIRRVPAETIRAIVKNWPRDFDPARATELGFTAESDFQDILRAHAQDELGQA